MASKSRTLHRVTIFSLTILALCTIGFLSKGQNGQIHVRDRSSHSWQSTASSQPHAETRKRKAIPERLNLTEEQCRTEFPGLLRPIDGLRGKGLFKFQRSNPDYKGLVQGRVKDNKLYVLTTAPDTLPDIVRQRTAVLNQIQRALLTSPTSLPDTHFAFVINDSPKNNSWVFASPNKESTYNTFLMPHFGFWSWPSPTLGTMDDILARINAVEESTKWEKKEDKVAWRGTPWFNPLGNPRLRQELIKVTKGKEWADVEALNISIKGEETNAIQIEDFCRYKYIVYTEGVTYSGRLPYHQACASVLLTPPLTYLTHTSYLLRPILGSRIMAAFKKPGQSAAVRASSLEAPYTNPVKPLLPLVTDWQSANSIYVSPDFSDLESVTYFLRTHPEVAQRIANNLREDVIRDGYLSTSAEVCYWRALLGTWAGVATADESWGDEAGERFEIWLLKEVSARR